MSKTLKASLRKTLAGIVMMTTIFSLSGVIALVPAAQAATIVDGDVIRNPSASGDAQFDVYIVKLMGDKKFKRLVLNPQVFNSYGHLKWENIKTVTTEEMNAYKTSAVIRVETDPKVFALAPNGDMGSKSWLNVAAADFIAAGGDWDSVYVINAVDGANYAASTDLTTQAQVQTFLTAGTLPGATPTPTPSVSGTVTVALAAENAGSSTLTKGSVGNSVLSFAVTASSDADAVLNTVKFKRTGVGLATDYSNVYVYEGTTRLKSGKSIASDTNTVEFTGVGLTVPKGTTKIVTVKADVYASAGAGDVNYMTIQGTSDIAFASGTVSGSFPISGSAMSIGSQSIGTSTVANGSSVSKPVIGQTGAKIANFRVTAGVNDIEVREVTLVQNGSYANTGFSNLTLKNSVTGDVLGTVAKMSGEKAIITLTSPLAISKSQNKTIDLYADISGGKTTDTVRFYLEETSDIIILDKQYGQNSAITNSFGSTAAYCVGNAVNACTVSSLQGGTITLADNGPAAVTVARNTINIDLLKFSMTSTRNVTFKDYDIVLTATNKANGTLGSEPADQVVGTESDDITITAHGLSVGDYIIVDSDATAGYSTTADMIAQVTTVTNANTVQITPVSGTDLDADNTDVWSTIMRIDTVRLTDTDVNNVLYSSSTVRYFYNGSLTSSIAPASDDFDITSGQTRHIALRVDINTYTAGGMTINGQVKFDTASRVKDNDANEYISTSDIVPNTLTGKNMTTGVASLTVALASTPVSATKVKGTQGVDILGASLTAGSSSKVKMTNLVVRFFADDDSTTDFDNGEGQIAANAVVDSASLYDGATQVGATKTLVLVGTIGADGGYYKATFDNLIYEIPAGASNKLTVRVNLNNTLSATRYLAADIVAASDVTAQDSDGNSLTVSGTGISRSNEADASPVPVFTVATSGTLSLNVEGAPSAALAVAGTTSVVMAKYKASALNEAFKIEKLDVASDTGSTDFATAETGNDNNLVRVGVRAGGNTTWSNLTAGVASFSALNIDVLADNSTYIEILADLNTIAGGATSGESPRLGIYQIQTTANTFRAVGQGSSVVKDYTTVLNTSVVGEENIKAMTVRKTVPTVAKATGMSTTLTNGTNTLYGFTVAADAGAAVSLRSVKFKLAYTNTAATDDIDTFKFYRGSTDLTDDVRIFSMGDGELADGTSLESTTVDMDVDDGGDDLAYDGYAVVEFNDSAASKETISAGSSNTYYLKVNAAGVNTTGDSVSTYIADDTDNISSSTLNYFAVARKTGTPIRFDSKLRDAGSGDNDAVANNVLYLDVDNSGTVSANDYILRAFIGLINTNETTALDGTTAWVSGLVTLGDSDAATVIPAADLAAADDLYIVDYNNAADAMLISDGTAAVDDDSDSVVDAPIRFDLKLRDAGSADNDAVANNVTYLDVDNSGTVSANDYIISAFIGLINTNETTALDGTTAWVSGLVTDGDSDAATVIPAADLGAVTDLYVADYNNADDAMLVSDATAAVDDDSDSVIDGSIVFDLKLRDAGSGDNDAVANNVLYIDADGGFTVSSGDYILNAFIGLINTDETTAMDGTTAWVSGLVTDGDSDAATVIPAADLGAVADLYIADYNNAADAMLSSDSTASVDSDSDTRFDRPGYNFIWADNSASLHDTNTTDWTNGYLVNDLATTTQTLSF